MSQDEEEATCTELTIIQGFMEAVKAVYIESLISEGDPPDLLLSDTDTDDSDVETDGNRKEEFVAGMITPSTVGNGRGVSHRVHGRSWKVMRYAPHIAQEVGEPGDYMRALAQQLTSSFCDQYRCLPACDRQGIVRDKHGELLLIVDHKFGITVVKDAPRGKGNARELSVRLATFRRMPQFWRKANPSDEALARVGFMYLGQEDRVHCFSCGVMVSNWDQKDPLREHFTKSPSCTFLRENFAAQVQQFEREHLSATHNDKYANSSARLHSFASWPLGYIATSYQLASVGFFYTGVRTKVQCFSCGLSYEEWRRGDIPLLVHRKLSPLCKFLNTLISKGVPTPTPITGPLPPSPPLRSEASRYSMPPKPAAVHYHEVQLHKDKVSSKPDWANEQIRHKSFKHMASVVPVSSEECAKAGLYFIRHPDVMRCFCCDVVLEGWIDGDVPVEKHREANPHCKFLLEFFPTKLEKQSFDDGFDPSTLPEPIYEPQNSPTLFLSRRLSQLHCEAQYSLSDSQYRQSSSYHSVVTPSSEHHYTVPPTYSTTGYTRQSLQSSILSAPAVPPSQPPSYHSVVTPSSEHHYTVPPTYSTTGYTHQSLQPSILSAPAVPPSQPPSYPSRLTATLDPSMSSAMSNQTASPAGSIRQYSPASSFNQGPFSSSRLQPAQSQYAPPSGSSLPPRDEFVGYSSHVPSPSAATGEPLFYSSQGRPVRLPPSYHLQRTPSLSLPPEHARINPMQLPLNYTVLLIPLLLSIDPTTTVHVQLFIPLQAPAPASAGEDNKVCVVCMDAPLQMVLVPCGHMCVCEECAQQISQCPICRKPTQSTMKVFIPY